MATPRQVSATVDRLLQWKKRNDAKREVRAKLQEDERVEEEEYYLSLSKALPQNRVEAAAIRNYRAAGELRWKKQMLQAIAEQQQLEEEAECAFRPRLEARPRQSARSIETKSTCCRPSCAAAAARADLGKVPPCRYRQAATEVKEDVFERLYKPHAESAADEHDQIDRQHRRVQLAAMQRFPHKPKLSRHTQEICAAQRNHDMDKLTDHCRRHHERLDACTRQVRYTVPPSSSGSCNQSYVSSIPFSLLIEALDQQEQRMRFIIKCA
ncbi:hypothetical protein PF005_g6491 [Phytophthora fragariae]|uniref:Uncharacterized protein n=1 Tax=Phytophthora fragariae TaxID=53985 RepID=A0A6A3ZV70_9STRA|nr:hypothetical protein PF005_g6491 [Phytophthora fragariae]KAE9244902.1 hypothetical protein PF002_g7528 [Phytophthora fragariae]